MQIFSIFLKGFNKSRAFKAHKKLYQDPYIKKERKLTPIKEYLPNQANLKTELVL